MIDLYPPVLRAFFRMVGQRWLEKLEAELWKYSQALNDWLYDLFLHPTPDWRERLGAFEAEQEAAGRTLTPESRAALVAYLEDWARGQSPEAEKTLTVAHREEPAAAVQLLAMPAAKPAPPMRAQTTGRKPNHYATGEIVSEQFWQAIAEAKRHLEGIGPVLKRVAQRIEAAAEGDLIDVMPDIEVIESLVWSHNAALEKARRIWLDGQLSKQDTIDALMQMSTPVAHGLPMFFDRAQAERAKTQWKEIGRRLDEKVSFLDDAIAVMEALETAGTVAMVLLTGVAIGGVLVTAFKTGSKMVLVRGAAAFGAGYSASYATGKLAGAAARAAGLSEETITRVQNVAEVVSWLITLRKLHKARLKELTNENKFEPPPTAAKSSNGNVEPASIGVSTATGLVPVAPVELGKWGEARLRLFFRGRGLKPKKAFKTSHGKRYVDWVTGRVAHEAKAGIDVGLSSAVKVQALKDAELVSEGIFDEVHWHFFQGAQVELLDFLSSLDIKFMVH